MTKYYLLTFLGLAFMVGQLNAQSCTPDLTLPDSVVVSPTPYTTDSPQSGIQDTACVDSYYETFFQFKIPPTVLFGGTEIAINSVFLATTGAIIDLPTGLTYACNPPNCVFQRDSTGCIVVYGTPPAGQEGQYDLFLTVTIDAGFPLTINLPNDLIAPGNYYLFVRPNNGPNCADVSATDLLNPADFPISVQPNPFADYADVVVNAPEGGRYQVRMFNALGSLVKQQTEQFITGENRFRVTSDELPIGMYYLLVTDGQRSVTSRLLLQR